MIKKFANVIRPKNKTHILLLLGDTIAQGTIKDQDLRSLVDGGELKIGHYQIKDGKAEYLGLDPRDAIGVGT